MPTETEVKDFLMKVIPQARKQGANKEILSIFLSKYNVAIRDIALNMEDGRSYMHIEYIGEDSKIAEAKFDLIEIDGRTWEEIEEEGEYNEENV